MIPDRCEAPDCYGWTAADCRNAPGDGRCCVACTHEAGR